MNHADISRGGLYGYGANSVMVPDGYTLVMYEGDGLSGNS
jgi:hypothetical protein